MVKRASLHPLPAFRNPERDGFYKELRQRVEQYFKDSNKPRRGGPEAVGKVAGLLSFYLVFYLAMLFQPWGHWATLAFALLFGTVNVLIVFLIGHDAAHNSLFEDSRWNKRLTYVFNLVGASAYMWDITHNQIHHAFPNVGEWDTDIQQQAPLIRCSPTVKRRWFHRFQPYYATLIYLTYSIYLVFLKDYQDIGWLPKKDSKWLVGRRHPLREQLILLFSKLVYYTLTIVVPVLVLDVSWQQFLLGFFIVHLWMSFLLSAVLIPVHLVDEATFAVVSGDGFIEDSWANHVVRNTTDYSAQNPLAGFLFGGLNTHLVHHLFPGVYHGHYRALSRILAETAGDFGLEYRNVTMWQAIVSHYRLLRRMSAA